jgi:hypothetical protein
MTPQSLQGSTSLIHFLHEIQFSCGLHSLHTTIQSKHGHKLHAKHRGYIGRSLSITTAQEQHLDIVTL